MEQKFQDGKIGIFEYALRPSNSLWNQYLKGHFTDEEIDTVMGLINAMRVIDGDK